MEDRLAQAAQEATRVSQARIAELVTLSGGVIHELRSAARVLGNETPKKDFVAFLNDKATRIADLLERQHQALTTFNIVLFGRTGAGKSSLVSAIAQTNGSQVSQGESDWTTRVEPVDWNSCRIYDTPGINGWGRSQSRESLETISREAVEVADVVLVCFDNQSQQAEEFVKLATWVKTYRKPVIAVLNVRNPRWRLPTLMPSGPARANLSRAVREHSGNIADELAKIELHGVPIVAISSKRALFARSSLPFEGPDAESLTKMRFEFGQEVLEGSSGYTRLEDLLVGAVSEHAVSLRLGALGDQLRGIIQELMRELACFERESREAAKVIELRQIQGVFAALGYPSRKGKIRREVLFEQGEDLLAELERLRGGLLKAPVKGEYQTLVKQHLETRLGALRSRSMQNAEECVLAAFDARKKLTASEVQSKVFDQSRMQADAEAVLAEGWEFLVKKVNLAQKDAQIGLKVLAESRPVAGDAGEGWKRCSLGLKVGGTTTGVAGFFGTLALTNIWNPIGWTAFTAGGIALVGGITSAALSWLGDGARTQAETIRLSARRNALAEIRKAVHSVYDDYEKQVLEIAERCAREAARAAFREPVLHALGLRKVAQICGFLSLGLSLVETDLPPSAEPQTLIFNTANELACRAFPGHKEASAQYWLGEDWVGDPNGLGGQTGDTDSAVSPGTRDIFDRLFRGLHNLLQGTTPLAPGTGHEWLRFARNLCVEDPAALDVLNQIGCDDRPRIVLVGDTNAGKSSFVKRLLLEAGCPVPDSLRVGARPVTERTMEYAWEDVILVDTPGLQGGNHQHLQTALAALPESAAIIYLFQPNLVLGDEPALLKALQGSREKRLIPKLETAFFVINRSDELGADPASNPDLFAQLFRRKVTELKAALSSRGLSVLDAQVTCMASDPYGLVGNRSEVESSELASTRFWDGFAHFYKAFQADKPALLTAGVERQLLGAGLAKLAELEAGQRLLLLDLGRETEANSRLRQLLEQAIQRGVTLALVQRTNLERLLADYVAGLREEVLAERNPEQLRIKAKSLQSWWADEALVVELKQWAKAAAAASEQWFAYSREEIEGYLESAEFKANLSLHCEAGPAHPAGAHKKSLLWQIADKIGRFLSGATRDFVYSVGKSLGHKFKPWGAVKLARTLGRVGSVIGAVGVAYDVYDYLQEGKREASREKERRNFAVFLSESVHRVIDTIGDGTEEDPGVLAQLDVAVRQFRQVAESLEEEDEVRRLKSESHGKKLLVYQQLIEVASTALGHPWGEEPTADGE